MLWYLSDLTITTIIIINSSMITTIITYVYVLRLPYRFQLLKDSYKRLETDGLNSLNYEIKSIKKLPLYTYFLVDVTDNHKL